MGRQLNGSQRLFIAIDLPEHIKEKIAAASRPLNSSGISPVLLQNMHITLLFLGSIKPDAIQSLTSALHQIKFIGFDITIQGFSTFSVNDPRVIFAKVENGSEMLERLHLDITERISVFGDALLPIGTEKFSPHLTVARLRHPDESAVHKVSAFLEENKEINIGTVHVSSFVLKRSVLTNFGPVYTDLRTFNSSDLSN